MAQGRNIGQGSLKNALRASLLWLYVQIWVEIEMRQEKTAQKDCLSFKLYHFWYFGDYPSVLILQPVGVKSKSP